MTAHPLDDITLPYCALPECDLAAIQLNTTLFDVELAALLMITGMTGGTDRARNINLVLAEAAQTHRTALGLGSQRASRNQGRARQSCAVWPLMRFWSVIWARPSWPHQTG